jgi:hypothetical protein
MKLRITRVISRPICQAKSRCVSFRASLDLGLENLDHIAHRLTTLSECRNLAGSEFDPESLFDRDYEIDVCHRIPTVDVGGGSGFGYHEFVIVEHPT